MMIELDLRDFCASRRHSSSLFDGNVIGFLSAGRFTGHPEVAPKWGYFPIADHPIGIRKIDPIA
jgi:hypothetical protein